MRYILKILIVVVFLVVLIFFVQSCRKRPALPVLTTLNVTEIRRNAATSGGIITNDGGDEVTERGSCWSINRNPTVGSSKSNEGIGTGIFISNLTGLTSNTKYYVRAYATNDVGTEYGNEISFTTGPVEAPSMTTAEASSVSTYYALTGGNITDDGGASITTRGICWDTIENPTILGYHNGTTSEERIYTIALKYLEPNTKYFARAYATNEVGTTYGNQILFTTCLIETKEPQSVTSTTAVSGGYGIIEGGLSISERGVCWSTSQNPTVADDKTTNGSGTGHFVSNIIGLTPNTTYYIRAYETSNAGTFYGNEFILKTFTGMITDIDGNVYKTVTIGSQLWMAENLKTTRYQNGDTIKPGLRGINDIVKNEQEPRYQWDKGQYGRYYTWYAAADHRNVCPVDWHLPTDDEWTVLTDFLGGEQVAGAKMRTTTGWEQDDGGIKGTNESGFSAHGGVIIRVMDGDTEGFSYLAHFWSSTLTDDSDAWSRTLYSGRSDVLRYNFSCRGIACSVRCLKD
jgi:uncharacterized protein (TIGR02145 family)